MECQSTAIAGDLPPSGRGNGAPVLSFANAPRPAVPMVRAPAEPIPAQLQNAAAVRGMNRYRLHVGDVIVELRHCPRQTSVDYRNTARRVLVLAPLTHALEIVTGAAHLTCPAGAGFLFARDEAATVVLPEGAWTLFLHLRREPLNAAASAATSDACRLMAVATLVDSSGDRGGLEPLAPRLLALIAGTTLPQGPAMPALEATIYRQLVAALVGQDTIDACFSPVRAVSEAMRVVRENHSRSYDTETLAALVGVTGSTLRKGFRAALGLSVKDYIQSVRLDWAHVRLASGHDSRTIAEIAQAAGFAETPPFSRAYLKRFGEPPSQTRARAVRALAP